MNYLRCIGCRQRFYTAATRFRILARCEICGANLRPVERPEDRPPELGPGDSRPPLPLVHPSVARAEPGTYSDDVGTYPSLVEFARADLARLYSPECDFGLCWRNGTRTYRAAWVEYTGELYIVQLGQPDVGGGHVELLARSVDREEVGRALLGWQGVIRDPGSLEWLRDRIRNDLRSQARCRPARHSFDTRQGKRALRARDARDSTAPAAQLNGSRKPNPTSPAREPTGS